MKKAFLFLFSVITSFCSFGQKNLTLLSNYTFAPGVSCAGVYHYNRSNHEYALVGTSQGVVIVDITNPFSPQHVYDIPDTPGLWMEVKGWGDYAYVSNEGRTGHGGGGITVIDLTSLPDTPVVHKKYTGDGAIAGQLSTGHTVQAVDTFLYVNGSNIGNQGTLFFSLADPWNPHFVGMYDTVNHYVHDCFVRGDTLITSELTNGCSIFNISDKSKPVHLKSFQTPSSFSHSSWMSDDDHYLFTSDEKPRAPLGSFDISDIKVSVPLVDLYWTTKNPVGEVHNPRVLNDFLVNACYGDSAHTGSQVTIVDASHPANLIETGNYQLCPPATGLMICWDADPFLPSGNIIATEGYHGLFVLAPVYKRACHIEGTITDSAMGNPLNKVKIEILMPPADTIVLKTDSSLFTGGYTSGVADSGSYDVRFSPSPALLNSGYVAKTIIGVKCDSTLNIKLAKRPNGIEENMASSGLIDVYPNPASNQLIIHTSAVQPDEAITISIMNVLGEIIQEEKASSLSSPPQKTGQAPERDYTINIKTLPSGIYFLQMNTAKGIFVQKFIKE